MLKHCKDCGETKTLADFTRDMSTRDGYAWNCRSCNSRRLRQWRQRNKDRNRAQRVAA